MCFNDIIKLGALANPFLYMPELYTGESYHRMRVRCEKLEYENKAMTDLVGRMRELIW